LAIHFQNSDVSFNLKQKKKLKEWIKFTIISEGKTVEDLSFIFCTDEFLLKINQNYLQHDYFTDIITFDLSNEINKISGELYISIERVKDNSKDLSVNFLEELNRVMIHGILHLCGYGDKKDSEIKRMREKEDFYLNLFTSNLN